MSTDADLTGPTGSHCPGSTIGKASFAIDLWAMPTERGLRLVNSKVTIIEDTLRPATEWHVAKARLHRDGE